MNAPVVIWLLKKRLARRLCQVVRSQHTPTFPNEGAAVLLASAVISKRFRWLNGDVIAQGLFNIFPNICTIGFSTLS